MSISWFSQGYQKVEEKAKEIENSMRTFVPNFFINENDENVYISFVTGEPITFYEHFVKSLSRSFTCLNGGDTTKGECPLCAMGNKPSFRGAFLIIDHRLEKFKTRDGKEVEQQHTLKLAKWGIRTLKQIQKLDEKLKKGSPVMQPVPNGILGVPFDVTRSGRDSETVYSFSPIQPNEEYFPRKYTLPKKDGKQLTEIETIIDVIKPLSKDSLLQKLKGGNSSSTSSPNPFGTPLILNDDDDVINFS